MLYVEYTWYYKTRSAGMRNKNNEIQKNKSKFFEKVVDKSKDKW